MTKMDRIAYANYKVMVGLQNEGLNLKEIASLMKTTIRYLISLQEYFG